MSQVIPKMFLKITYERQFKKKGRVEPWQQRERKLLWCPEILLVFDTAAPLVILR